MKNILFIVVCLLAMLVAPVSSFAQSPAGLSNPTKAELEAVIGGMGLSTGEKLSLRTILQAMQGQGTKVKANDALSDEQKVAQIVKIRQGALGQTQKILAPAQQRQLVALFLP